MIFFVRAAANLMPHAANRIKSNISGLHAEALSTHLLIVLKNYITGKKPGSIPEENVEILNNVDQVYQKLRTLTEAADDETAQTLTINIPEAEALIKAFIEPAFKDAALKDSFYQKHSYGAYFERIYAGYLREVGAGYVLALAA
jgi:hypothetical protein